MNEFQNYSIGFNHPFSNFALICSFSSTVMVMIKYWKGNTHDGSVPALYRMLTGNHKRTEI